MLVYQIWCSVIKPVALFFTGDSSSYEVPAKKFRQSAIDMPLLMYLCDEMAREGYEEFFRALIQLRIWEQALAKRSAHYNNFAVTAQEHGHHKLAAMISKSSGYLRF